MSRTDAALNFDRYACGALVVAARPFAPVWSRFRPLRVSEVREVAVAKYVGLGSILLLNRLLTTLRRRFPAARLTFVTFDLSRPIFEFLPGMADDVIEVKTRGGAIAGSTLAAAAELRKRRIDAFFDAEFYSRYSALVAFLARPAASAGFESLLLPSRTAVYSHPAKFVPSAHISENFLNLARTLGLEAADAPVLPSLSVPDRDRSSVAEKLRALGVAGPYLVLNPSASDALGGYRRWPAERWVGFARRALSAGRGPVVFTGVDADRPLTREIVATVGAGAHDLAGEFSLGEHLALLSGARLVATIDGGTAHFSAALGRPTVILFGPESPALYGYDLPHCRCVYKSLYCSPCYNIHHGKKIVCRNDSRCMTTMDDADVWRETESLLGNA